LTARQRVAVRQSVSEVHVRAHCATAPGADEVAMQRLVAPGQGVSFVQVVVHCHARVPEVVSRVSMHAVPMPQPSPGLQRS
jgi:hypothetical protein